MSSKWVNKDDFSKFRDELKADSERRAQTGGSKRTFPTKDAKNMPWKGTNEDPNVYEMRLLPNPSGGYYKRLLYHMIESPRGSKQWNFFVCPKTENFNNYCPICAAQMKLYAGSDEDRSIASRIKRKEKYVVNTYIIDDPRDRLRSEEEKTEGKVFLYEFPGKVEQLLRSQINDEKNGVGPDMFDPENGFNFILKVGKDGDWPSYNTSNFARKPTAIAEGKELKELMDQRIDIKNYIQKNIASMEDMVQLLEAENLFDLIEREHEAMMGVSSTTETKSSRKPVEEDPEKEEDYIKHDEDEKKTEETKSTSSSIDEDLLAELEGLES